MKLFLGNSFLILGLLIAPISFGATVWDSNLSGNFEFGSLEVDNYHEQGQCFSVPATSDLILDSATFLMKKYGSPVGNMYAKLYSITGTCGSNATPVTLLTTSNPSDTSTLTTSNVDRTFQFDGTYSVTASTNYYIGVYYDGDGDATGNGVYVRANTPSNHSGNISYRVSGAWTANSSYDTYFSVSGIAEEVATSSSIEYLQSMGTTTILLGQATIWYLVIPQILFFFFSSVLITMNFLSKK